MIGFIVSDDGIQDIFVKDVRLKLKEMPNFYDALSLFVRY
jgi:cold shock CspA family protein